MQKELLEIEFRYHDRPIGSCPATSCSKTIAIGIFWKKQSKLVMKH